MRNALFGSYIWLTKVKYFFLLYEIWGSQGREDVDVGLLGCKTLWTCRWFPTFRRNVAPLPWEWRYIPKFVINVQPPSSAVNMESWQRNTWTTMDFKKSMGDSEPKRTNSVRVCVLLFFYFLYFYLLVVSSQSTHNTRLDCVGSGVYRYG
jgi:hypothetical protein